MDDKIVPEPKDFKMSDYARTIIEMYDGVDEEVELICDNELMKNVIDKFGEDIRTEKISDNKFKAVVMASISKTFFAWCFRFAGQMEIVSPLSVRKEYQEMARRVVGG